MAGQRHNGFIPQHGGYKNLITYQKAEIIYDGTVYFTGKYFKPYDRTVDQMVQAARSGKQNIVEARMISATSKALEINLTNVARASLEELKVDYLDFLRIRNIPVWSKGDVLYERFSELNRTNGLKYNNFQRAIENNDAGISANSMICLIGIVSYLLFKQIKHLESAFIREGDLRERMTHACQVEKNRTSPQSGRT